MGNKQVAIITADLITAYGVGAEKCWRGMLEQRSAITELERFPTEQFSSQLAATIPGLTPQPDCSLVWQMLDTLNIAMPAEVINDAWLFLASTVGEIDLLENAVTTGTTDDEACQINLLQRCLEHWEIAEGRLINAACASSTIALARAAAMISDGIIPAALVIGCDCVSEFVFSGFSALGAMSSEAAAPFDLKRSGLTLGEATGAVVLMDAELAAKYSLAILANISGWGMSADAKHMTAPDEHGTTLAHSIKTAMTMAAVEDNELGGIMAHGTGTVYNDAMELAALRSLFSASPKPMFSTKSGTGHTLGAAGIVQTVMALQVLEHRIMPPQGNLRQPMVGADGWVAGTERPLAVQRLLSINAGFGGINAAIILSK